MVAVLCLGAGVSGAAGQSNGLVMITEIMANPRGSDSFYEWIEIYNATTGSIDLASYRFRERCENHMLQPFVLAPHAFAIIAQNPANFLERYPHLAGRVIDSTFSLANGGDLLEILRGTNYPADRLDAVNYVFTNGFPLVIEGRSMHLRLHMRPTAAGENDAGARWRTADINDGISTAGGDDIANPGTAYWLKRPDSSMLRIR